MTCHLLRNLQDIINHPQHYEKHKITVEPIDLIDTCNFCIGNVIKYIVRSKDKGNELEDLKKARFYLNRAGRNWIPKYGDEIARFAVLRYCDVDLLRELGGTLTSGYKPSEAWEILKDSLGMRIALLEYALKEESKNDRDCMDERND